MFYKNNWFAYSYDSIPFGNKTNVRGVFDIKLTPTVTTVNSYYTELCNNAKQIRDMFTGKLDLLFSGGIDSEVVLRTYKDLNIPINVYVFKYENDYNQYEFSRATKICESINVSYKVIDFNLQKFFEQEAYDIWTKVYCLGSGWLPLMKMMDYLDGTPMVGSGEPYWVRTSKDWNTTHPWHFEIDEGAKAWTVYCKNINRIAVTDWYEYSPELLISHTNLPLIQDLINDKLPGKLSSFSSKSVVHKQIWPDIEVRQKMIGFEGQNKPGSKPMFMKEFDTQYSLDVDSRKFYFSEQELRQKLVID
jgi:hypothetical protein